MVDFALRHFHEWMATTQMVAHVHCVIGRIYLWDSVVLYRLQLTFDWSAVLTVENSHMPLQSAIWQPYVYTQMHPTTMYDIHKYLYMAFIYIYTLCPEKK